MGGAGGFNRLSYVRGEARVTRGTERGGQGENVGVLTGSGDEGRWPDFEDDDGRRPADRLLSWGALVTPGDGKRCSGCGSTSRCSGRCPFAPKVNRDDESGERPAASSASAARAAAAR
jgi:hypothetical protein